MFDAVTERYRGETVVRKSRFITTLVPISDKEEAENAVKAIHKEFSQATHHCYAYIADENASIMRFSDDGEPQGTAGMPMLETLRKRNIARTLAVVTRFFGGIKLGAAGLLAAYTNAVSTALDNASVKTFKLSNIYRVRMPYSMESAALNIIGRSGVLIDRRYSDSVELDFAIYQADAERAVNQLKDSASGKIEIILTGADYV